MDKEFLEWYMHWSEETGLPNGVVIVSRNEYLDSYEIEDVEKTMVERVRFNLVGGIEIFSLYFDDNCQFDKTEMTLITQGYASYLQEVN